MRCITPIDIKNPKRIKRLSDSEIMQVPCGKCSACRKRRAKQWTFRLLQEEKIAATAYFITYTYDQCHVPTTPNGYLSLDPKAHTNFMKRLRKRLSKEELTLPLKYYMVGEYGGETERPHYHSIMFNLPEYFSANEHRLEEIWKNGRVQVDNVTGASIGYVTGYVNKMKHFINLGENDDRIPEFTRISKGMGLNWLTEQRIKWMKNTLSPTVKNEQGHDIGIPRYYKKKALTEYEQTLVALNALEHFEEKPTFENEKHKMDYVLQDMTTSKRKAKRRNKV